MPAELIVKVRIRGVVQGVGYRFFAYRNARELNIKGYVKNLSTGEVEVLARGKRTDVMEFLSRIQRGPSYARIEGFEIKEISEEEAPALKEFFNFRIY